MVSYRVALGAACAMAVLSGGSLSAQPYYGRGDGYDGGYAPGLQYSPRPYFTPERPAAPPAYGYYQGPSAEQREQFENDRSGTLGRMGLGADPRHPEGPGNQSLGGVR